MTFLTLDAQIVLFITGTLLPLLVGVVTKMSSPSWAKAWLHAILSLVSGIVIVATKVDGTAVISKQTVITAVLVWITGMAAYHGFLKPTWIAPTVQRKTAEFGV